MSTDSTAGAADAATRANIHPLNAAMMRVIMLHSCRLRMALARLLCDVGRLKEIPAPIGYHVPCGIHAALMS
jgi:hypothetical protein